MLSAHLDSNIERLRQKFAEKSGLSVKMIRFSEKDSTGYASLIVRKDGEGEDADLALGQLAYHAHLQSNPKREAGIKMAPAVDLFLDLCAQKLKDDDIDVPPLQANVNYWADCYRQTLS